MNRIEQRFSNTRPLPAQFGRRAAGGYTARAAALPQRETANGEKLVPLARVFAMPPMRGRGFWKGIPR